MANISEYLKNILSARYGRDVRQSIHDGINAINDEVAADKNEVVTSMDAAAKSASEAKKSATNASESASDASGYADAANLSATNAKTSETNAKESENNAGTSASAASASADSASDSAEIAKESATTATQKASETSASASSAKTYASTANGHANTANTKASEAAISANTATLKAGDASASALVAESYAVGGTGTRENEDADNSKYYYEQTKQISQGINGIVPMGTVTFAELPTKDIVNNAMYNVSDAFTSDERFNDGGGIYYGPGNNVVYTAEGKWDVTASSAVTGIRGANEATYRQGNVTITKENIGLGNVDNTSDADKPISTATQEALNAINSSLNDIFYQFGLGDIEKIAFQAVVDYSYIQIKFTVKDTTNDEHYIFRIHTTTESMRLYHFDGTEYSLLWKMDNLTQKAGYINSQNSFEPARLVAIQRTLTYTDGVADLDISSMGLTTIHLMSINVVGSAVTYSAYGSITNSGQTLRSVLSNASYNGDLPTSFLVLCSV